VVFVDQSAESVAALDLSAARLRTRVCRVGREQRDALALIRAAIDEADRAGRLDLKARALGLEVRQVRGEDADGMCANTVETTTTFRDGASHTTKEVRLQTRPGPTVQVSELLERLGIVFARDPFVSMYLTADLLASGAGSLKPLDAASANASAPEPP
jgi:hypothetical protein